MPASEPKRILLVNDLPGYGRVALAAMIPVLSKLGFAVSCLPTALVSNTFDYGRCEMLDTTDYIERTLKIWDELGFSFPAICTGFITSKKQALLIRDYCARQKELGARILVDPIMADNGKLYSGLDPDIISNLRTLCAGADVIVPNLTEACFLADAPVETSCSEEKLQELTDQLLASGAGAVVITSVVIAEKNYTAVRAAKDAAVELLPFERIPGSFPGTGDLFTALLAGHVLQGESLADNTRKAMRVIEELIRLSRDSASSLNGLPIETHLDLIRN